MKVEQLALSILKNDKLETEKLVKHLASAVDDEITCGQEYKDLYECAYGKKLSNDILTEWVKSMAVTDSSERENGQKWTVEQCYEVGQKLSIDWNKVSKNEWYAVLNMMFSDYYKTAKSFSMQEDTMFFGRLAKDWLFDEDAPSPCEKLYNYYFAVICC